MKIVKKFVLLDKKNDKKVKCKQTHSQDLKRSKTGALQDMSFERSRGFQSRKVTAEKPGLFKKPNLTNTETFLANIYWKAKNPTNRSNYVHTRKNKKYTCFRKIATVCVKTVLKVLSRGTLMERMWQEKMWKQKCPLPRNCLSGRSFLM